MRVVLIHAALADSNTGRTTIVDVRLYDQHEQALFRGCQQIGEFSRDAAHRRPNGQCSLTVFARRSNYRLYAPDPSPAILSRE